MAERRKDEAHEWTERRLKALERRIAAEYGRAARELQEVIDEYFSQFAKRDAEQLAKLKAGEITEEYYKQWRLAQIGRGERFEALRDRLSERMTRANEVAAAYINDATPGIYSLNRNYSAYTIEQVAGDVGFDLWDEQTVKRLLTEQPDLMPYYPPEKAVKRGIDLKWGKQQITEQVTSGILQGESVKHLADRLQKNIPDMNRNSAIRSARTAVTGAQNAGRMASYDAAEKMGIKLKKEWLATLDGRTRHSHAVLDGEKAEKDKKFSNGCMFPGDPNGPASEIYNCRCTLIASMPDVDTSDAQRRAKDPVTGESVLIEDMTYAEWAGWKEKKSKPAEIKHTEEYKEIKSVAEKEKIAYNEVQKLAKRMSEPEIVEKLAGGDMTSGSCSSLAFAYIGNQCGYDVTDFRGGNSAKLFGRNNIIQNVINLKGVESSTTKVKKELDGTWGLLQGIERGKEYYLGAGRHSAIVRRKDDGFEYLELQSASNNGWKPLDKKILSTRFGCRKTEDKMKTSSGYYTFERTVFLAETGSFKDNDEFKEILGYINTNKGEQKKGASGGVK